MYLIFYIWIKTQKSKTKLSIFFKKVPTGITIGTLITPFLSAVTFLYSVFNNPIKEYISSTLLFQKLLFIDFLYQ